MRLFVGLELPAGVRAALASWAAAAAPPSMRRVPAENLHVTLAFLGTRAPEDAEAVSALLDGLARPLGALAVEGPLWLPPRRPGVLAAALGAGPALAQLHTDLVAGLERAIGLEPERRPLRAHVTVARSRREARLRAVEVEAPPALTFAAEALVLYRSHTGAGGARYEPLARVKAGDGLDE
jgi:2'-5' RNA ligase